MTTSSQKKQKFETYWAVTSKRFSPNYEEYIVGIFALGCTALRVFRTKKEALSWKTDSTDKVKKCRITIL